MVNHQSERTVALRRSPAPPIIIGPSSRSPRMDPLSSGSTSTSLPSTRAAGRRTERGAWACPTAGASGGSHNRRVIAPPTCGAGIARIGSQAIYRRTTIGDPFRVLPDLVQRDSTPSRYDELWVGDITDVSTWDGGCYLCTTIDCFSRRVWGLAMADHVRSELLLIALNMALAPRNPRGTLIHHTEGGSGSGSV